tara:strand:+ start:1298 stop:2080 length:783 start_codon:yes stop_codon:yes gene_type:complete
MKYGIEIEFKGDRRIVGNHVNRALVVAGYTEGCSVEGYNHTTPRGWKVVTDASLASGNTGAGELVSPILYDEDGLKQLEIVCKAAVEAGATVDRQTGVHVHHDATALTVNTVRNLFKLYTAFETDIDSIMAPSRRGSQTRWCKSMVKGSVEQTHHALNRAQTLREIWSVFGHDRYHKVNLDCYWRQSTVEFRQHGGSLDAEKIGAWVVLTNALINSAANTKAIRSEYKEGFRTLVRMVRKNGAKDVTRFIKKRRAELEVA